jgi:NAD(P)-dependent dehydrogenase (short-subunit alcohol dehydrogenase family)
LLLLRQPIEDVVPNVSLRQGLSMVEPSVSAYRGRLATDLRKAPAAKVAWVTGASSGIGRALAHRLATEGWAVAASARTARALDSLAAEVPEQITSFQLDVTDPAACERAVAEIEASLGPIGLAVLNAGGAFPVSLDNFSVENFRKTVDLNLMGVVNCMGSLVPRMRQRQTGHIAIVASVAGFVGVPGSGAYGATKAALNQMAESFKPEFERAGITLTIINPGFVETPLTEKNRYPMPFLMPLDKAVDRIMRGLHEQRYEIVFPWQTALLMRTLRILPHWLLFRLTRRMLRR